MSTRDLTYKQRNTILAYMDPDSPSYLNKIASVKRFYNAKNSNSATVIASEVITKDNLQKLTNQYPELHFDPYLDKKLSKEWILSGIAGLIESKKTKPETKLKAYELLGKFKELSLFREHNISETIDNTSDTEESLDEEFRSYINNNKQFPSTNLVTDTSPETVDNTSDTEESV